jgi:Ni/Co efflux regulator RcnB
MRAALTFVLASTVCVALSSPVWADKDKDKDRGGKDHGRGASDNNREQGKGRDDGVRGQGPGRDAPAQIVIIDRDRSTVRTYYRTEYVAGNCPPGLAKRNNGCMPPGQAKKMWSVGQPLPSSVVYHSLPPALYGQLTPPPPGYSYVRVDDDILLLSTVTRMIIGSLGNLGQLND